MVTKWHRFAGLPEASSGSAFFLVEKDASYKCGLCVCIFGVASGVQTGHRQRGQLQRIGHLRQRGYFPSRQHTHDRYNGRDSQQFRSAGFRWFHFSRKYFYRREPQSEWRISELPSIGFWGTEQT